MALESYMSYWNVLVVVDGKFEARNFRSSISGKTCLTQLSRANHINVRELRWQILQEFGCMLLLYFLSNRSPWLISMNWRSFRKLSGSVVVLACFSLTFNHIGLKIIPTFSLAKLLQSSITIGFKFFSSFLFLRWSDNNSYDRFFCLS